MAEQDRVIGGSRALCFALAGALLLVLAGCATTTPSTPGPTGGQQVAEAPPSAYIKMMREHGINVAVPTRGKFIIVNIPSYELVAFKDGEPVLRSRVVVGQPATRTPELNSSMFAVRFNPSWTPTPSMIRNEAAVYIPPGPNNPLGRMMLELDNDQFIYLHDTNQKGLFKRERRAFSHGCIRVEQVRALAAWALGVTEDEIGKMIARGSTYSVPLPEEIPVFLVYYTRFPDERGQIASYPDVYVNWQAEERAYLARAAARRMAVPTPVKPAAAPAPPPAAGESPAPPGEQPPAAPTAPSEPPQPTAEAPPATAPTAAPAPAAETPKPTSD
ncbi:hypothetical protein FHP25_26495 [Vineibacter terrae]|uniref:L,D-TPase catalytic domain-containing protein n=1 Tax=Vineibacter terrae TaxID=2586908 RepID=A0A5C8PF92_9HYPH|nr:L,D-transpeptidase family protein [Vineibacter terrae]TXL72182.1 hypothetical protein FHP25_26495 [Vineibacter terrae]